MNGRVVSEIVLGERKFDLLVRLDDPFRNDPQELRRMTLEVPRGGQIPLSAVAEVVDSSGPNTINRENVRRRIMGQSPFNESKGEGDRFGAGWTGSDGMAVERGLEQVLIYRSSVT